MLGDSEQPYFTCAAPRYGQIEDSARLKPTAKALPSRLAIATRTAASYNEHRTTTLCRQSKQINSSTFKGYRLPAAAASVGPLQDIAQIPFVGRQTITP
jgi:hypothetical protein